MKSYDIENTPELIDQIMNEAMQLTDENIAWRFNSCPRFALAFKARYPDFTKETYLRQAVELLQESGLTFKIRCFTENRKSKYSYLYSIEMYINGEWEWESETLHESNVFIYWVNDATELFDRLNKPKR